MPPPLPRLIKLNSDPWWLPEALQRSASLDSLAIYSSKCGFTSSFVVGYHGCNVSPPRGSAFFTVSRMEAKEFQKRSLTCLQGTRCRLCPSLLPSSTAQNSVWHRKIGGWSLPTVRKISNHEFDCQRHLGESDQVEVFIRHHAVHTSRETGSLPTRFPRAVCGWSSYYRALFKEESRHRDSFVTLPFITGSWKRISRKSHDARKRPKLRCRRSCLSSDLSLKHSREAPRPSSRKRRSWGNVLTTYGDSEMLCE